MQLERILYELHHTTDSGTKITVACIIITALIVIIYLSLAIIKSRRDNDNGY